MAPALRRSGPVVRNLIGPEQQGKASENIAHSLRSQKPEAVTEPCAMMVRIWETFTTLARGSPASIAVPDDLLAAVDRAGVEATVVKTSYLAIPVEQVARLMQTVGFENIGRVDGRFFQPVLVGSRPVV